MVCVKSWVAYGFQCRVLEAPLKNLNGYVAVPKTHPAFGVDYDKLGIDVHGGLTFGSQGGASDERWPGKEKNYPNPELYWFGFDTAHSGDWVEHHPYGHKWTLEEVVKETENMARQFSEMKQKLFLDYSAKWDIEKAYGKQFLDKLLKGELTEQLSNKSCAEEKQP